MLLESSFYWLFCLKFLFKLITFSKSYAKKQKWVILSEHSVYSKHYFEYTDSIIV